MHSASFILGQWTLALLNLLMNAASGIPFIIGAGLVAGRRGNAGLLLNCAKELFHFNLALALTGALYFLCAYLIQILPYKNEFADAWLPFFQAPGLPYSSSLVSWLTGILFLHAANRYLPAVSQSLNSYEFLFIKKSLFCCGLCLAFFFFTFCLVNWPFAGLPESLAADRAALAIFRNAVRQFFTCLGIAAAFSLVYLCLRRLPQNLGKFMAKGLAVIAILCHLPYILQNWSIFLGLYYSGQGSLISGGYFTRFLGMAITTIAIFCWLGIILRPALCKLLSLIGLGMMILSLSIPALFQLYRLQIFMVKYCKFLCLFFLLFTGNHSDAAELNDSSYREFAQFSVSLPPGWSGDETNGFISDNPLEYMLAFTKKNDAEDAIEAQVTVYLLPNRPQKNARESALVLAKSQADTSAPFEEGKLWTFTGEPRSAAVKGKGQTWVNAAKDRLLIIIAQDPHNRGARNLVDSLRGISEDAKNLLGR